jgi:4-aminobutyrate aminotransferase and related aminotransferases
MKKKLLKFRKKFIGPNLSIAYDEPLYLVKSKNQYLYDNQGNKYLDVVGNINHIGHCNTEVLKALNKQSSKLNTNTRYLYDIMEKYTKNLLKHFPKKLCVVYYV